MRDFIYSLILSIFLLLGFSFGEYIRDCNTEKSGVWVNGDRAYKLVRIEK